MNIQCCYNNRIEDFLQEDGNTWIETMKSTFLEMSDLPLEESQIRAWKDCFKVLKEQLPEIQLHIRDLILCSNTCSRMNQEGAQMSC